jgi:hypothetical protein
MAWGRPKPNSSPRPSGVPLAEAVFCCDECGKDHPTADHPAGAVDFIDRTRLRPCVCGSKRPRTAIGQPDGTVDWECVRCKRRV